MSDNEPKDRARLEAFEREIAQDPRSLVFIALAEEHNRLGNFEDAAAVAQKGLVYHPDSVAGRLALALAESGRNNVRQSLEQIKRALLIDPENPKALALMGRILLQKGLGKRAVQFLNHAVKLAPDEIEYQELLKAAKKSVQAESPLPSASPFVADRVRDLTSPWSTYDDPSESDFNRRAPDAEHTVFDPEALKKLRGRDDARSKGENGSGKSALDMSLDETLAAIGEEMVNEEPTRFDGRARKPTIAAPTDLPPPRRGDREVSDGEVVRPREEPTTFDTKNPLEGGKRKPKLGGSAAEFSRMMRNMRDAPDKDLSPVDEDATVDGRGNGHVPIAPSLELEERNLETPAPPRGEAPVRGEPDPVPVIKSEKAKSGNAKAPSSGPAPSSSSSSELKLSAKAKESREAEPAKDAADDEKRRAKEAAREAAREAKEAKEKIASPAAPDPIQKAVGTRMVDEALWALLGGKIDPSSGPKSSPSGAEAPAKPEKKKDEPKSPAEAKEKDRGAKGKPEKAAAAGPMVVRTSERFGTIFRASVLLVLVVSSTWLGYALAVSSGGAPPETASEEVKGIASDLERGGLARLIAAEEKVFTLVPSLPQLSDLFTAVLAEVYARRWASFGRDPEMLAKANEKVEAMRGSDPTVELLAARVLLSTSAQDRGEIDAALDRAIKQYPESPKAWVLRSRIAMLENRPQDAEDDLYAARAINPQHRMTLLDLARWHARQGTYPSAFSYYDQLQSLYPEDVEVAIERYVLGQISGRDPSESQATATLAGLVRQELAEVAKDEAGRVALAFALPRLARGEYASGLEELGKADGAFDHSAEFKSALAGMYLAIGQWDRARRQYERALQIEPDNPLHRLGIARASFGERAGLRLKPDDLKKESGKKKKGDERPDGPSWSGGIAQLQYATVRFVLGRFALVDVDPNRDVFPEAAYAAAVKEFRREELRDALESSTLVALALEKLKTPSGADDAMAFLDDAQKLKDDAAVRVAFGRAYLAKKDTSMSTRYFKKALEIDRDNVQARIGLASVLAEKNDVVGAIDVLDEIDKSDSIVPQAIFLLAKLRMQRGDYERALPSLETLALLTPRDANALMLLGEAQHRSKKTEEALESFRRAAKANPRLLDKMPEKLGAIPLLYLGRLELERDEARGIALLKRSLKHDDPPDQTHFFLGKALLRRGKSKKQAKKELETFRTLVTSGELYEEAGRLLR
jgi:tetratricopeptide (TPR) repeat protein